MSSVSDSLSTTSGVDPSLTSTDSTPSSSGSGSLDTLSSFSTSTFSLSTTSNSTSPTLSTPTLSMQEFAKLITSTKQNFQDQLFESQISDYSLNAASIEALSLGFSYSAIVTKLNQDIANLNNQSSLNSAVDDYNSTLIQDTNLKNSALTEAIDQFNQNLLNQDPSLGVSLNEVAARETQGLNLSMNSYNQALVSYNQSVSSFNQGLALYKNGSIDNATFTNQYVTPFQTAVNNYNQALSGFSNQVNNYNLIANSINTSIASFYPPIPNAYSLLSNMNAAISDWNTTITSLEPPTLPKISSVLSQPSMPIAKAPSPVTLDETTPATSLSPLTSLTSPPNLTLSLPQQITSLNTWFNQIIDLKNSKQITDAQFSSLTTIYNQYVQAYNTSYQSNIDTLNEQITAYNQVISQYNSDLGEYNTIVKELSNGKTFPLLDSIPQATGIPTYTTDTPPFPYVTLSPFKIPTIQTPTLAEENVNLTIVLSFVNSVIDTVTQNNKFKAWVSEYQNQKLLLFGTPFILPPTVSDPNQNKGKSSAGTVANAAMTTVATGLESSNLILSLSKSALTASITKTLEAFTSLQPQMSLLLTSTLFSSALSAAFGTTATLAQTEKKLETLSSEATSARVTFSLHFLASILNALSSGDLSLVIDDLIKRGLFASLQQTLPQAEVDRLKGGLTAAISLQILSSALGSVSQALQLPGIFPQILGSIPGLFPDGLPEATSSLTLSQLLANPISSLLISQNIQAKLISEGLDPSQADTFINALLLSLSDSKKDPSDIELQNQLTEKFKLFFPSLQDTIISNLANQTAAFIDAEKTLPFLDAKLPKTALTLTLADAPKELIRELNLFEIYSIRGLRDALTTAYENLGISSQEALAQANQKAKQAFDVLSSSNNPLASPLQAAGQDLPSMQSTLISSLKENGVDPSLAQGLVEGAFLSISPQSTELPLIYHSLAANLIEGANQQFSQINLSVVQQMAKNLQDIADSSLKEAKQTSLLKTEVFRQLLTENLKKRLEPEWGNGQSSQFTNQLLSFLIGPSQGDLQQTNGSSLSNQIKDQIQTLKKLGFEKEFTHYLEDLKEQFLPTLEIYAFNERLRDPANHILYSAQTGIMYGQNKSLKDYKELDIAV